MIQKLLPYWQAMYDVLHYQLATKITLSIWLYVLNKLFNALLKSTGRVALSSGDFRFLFTTWQGILIIFIGLVTLLVYVAMDLIAMIELSGDLIKGRKTRIIDNIKKAFRIMPAFMKFEGIGVILYIALLAPILGFGMSISLTQSLYIPTFITSVIKATPLYLVLATITIIIFIMIGLANIFILHGVILDDYSLGQASDQSRELMNVHGWDYFKQNLMYTLTGLLILAAIALITIVLPLLIIDLIPVSKGLHRELTLFVLMLGIVLSTLAGLYSTPLYIMKLTQLYYTYKESKQIYYPIRNYTKHPVLKMVCACIVIMIAAFSLVLNDHFDQVFPVSVTTRIIAHRAGGNEAAENTVAGIETAYELGAYGSEIDIQRTADGHYIILHDSNFKRVAGDKRKPEQMSLDEVKMLKVDGQPIPTFEEMLEASRGKVTLFIELKGSSADQQMAEDAVQIVKEMGMEDEVVLISLKYDVISYIETTYPEMHTAYLTWLSFGNTAALNCDYIGLEEESGTSDAIRAIHKQGKGALIWTVNGKQSQHRFLCSDADCIITDNVKQANEIKKKLEHRTDIERIVDKILSL